MNGKDKITKMNNMEIKVGDKVRVREDAPKIFLLGWYGFIGNVVDIEDSYTKIECNDCTLVIPTKYLVKVDAEKKEPEYKYQVGQKVKSAYANEILTIKERCGRVRHDNVYKVEEYAYTWNECELQPCTEPTEQTEAEEDARIRQKEAELEAFRKSELDRVLHPEKSHTYEVTVDNVAMDWQRYEADLTKEVALKVANKFNSPYEAAEYAVKVAKAVVEGLKRK